MTRRRAATISAAWGSISSSAPSTPMRSRSAVRDAGAVDVDAMVAEVRRIESGRPVFGKDMTEDTIPLEAGIEDRAISLTRGATSARRSSSACCTAATGAWRAGSSA